MATADPQPQSREFVIEGDADRLLRNFSRDLSDVILNIASTNTTKRSKQGLPLVDSCDIAEASQFLCDALRTAIDKGQITGSGQQALESLMTLCSAASDQCGQDDE